MRSTPLLAAAIGGAAAAVSAFTTTTSSCNSSIQLRSRTFQADVASSRLITTTASKVSLSPSQKLSTDQLVVANALPWSRRHNDGEVGPSKSQAVRSSLFSAASRKTQIALKGVHHVIRTVRRAFALVAAAALVYFGSAHIHTLPSHANTATPAVRVIPGKSQTGVQLASSTATGASKARLDQMVDRYVRKHMFADDAFDPLESAYREAHADQTSSSYPDVLTDTAAEILGKKEVAKSVAKDSTFDVVLAKVNKFADLLERKYGINRQLSISSIFIASFSLPAVAVLAGGVLFGTRQRAKSDRLAEKRYGKNMMDVSAVERIDDDIDAPDDDEYDSDDEDEDDDDE